MTQPNPGEPQATQDPRHPSSDPDYSRLQSEVGHTGYDQPVTDGAWPQPEGGDTDTPDPDRRQQRFDEIDRRAEIDAAREVRARETSAQK